METPTKIQFLSAIIEGNGVSEQRSAVKAMTVRLPLIDYAMVQAMAESSNSTKQGIVTNLVSAAIDEVIENLSDDRVEALRDAQAKILKALLDSGENENDTTTLGVQK